MQNPPHFRLKEMVLLLVVVVVLCVIIRNTKSQFQEIISFRKSFRWYFLIHTAINLELYYGSVDPALWESFQFIRNSEDHIRKTLNCQNIRYILVT